MKLWSTWFPVNELQSGEELLTGKECTLKTLPLWYTINLILFQWCFSLLNFLLTFFCRERSSLVSLLSEGLARVIHKCRLTEVVKLQSVDVSLFVEIQILFLHLLLVKISHLPWSHSHFWYVIYFKAFSLYPSTPSSEFHWAVACGRGREKKFAK